MKRDVLLVYLLSMLIFPAINGQSRIENRNNFHEAESWVLYEDFEEALPLYLQLTRIYPNNSNIKYRIGQCYINIPGEKDKAASYLEEAVQNINPEYKEGRFKETSAPFDAYYHLANAYRINNEIDKALETYTFFMENMDNNIYDSVIIRQEIQSCLNAKDLMATPLYIREQNLGTNINDDNDDSYPVISIDETSLIYSKSLAFYDAILYSTKVNGEWTNPLNLNEMLMVDNDLYPTSISSDGKTLYLYSTANYDGIIYQSTLTDEVWGSIVELNENINTKYWESHATISNDGNKLFFTSNRKGTYGGLDIYVSTRDAATGDWGPATNLGPVINTPYNEESPFLSKDGKTLFFSSRGHLNIGGYDIYYSSLLENGEWSVPLNAGFPVNSTDDDLFFNPVNEGFEGYYAKEVDGGLGKKDIYRIEIFSEDHPRKFLIKGIAKLGNQFSLYDDSLRVKVFRIKDLSSPENIIEIYTEPETGNYEFNLKQGDYEVIYESENGQTIKRDLNLALDDPDDIHTLDDILVPLTDYIAEMEIEAAKELIITDGDTLYIPITIEPYSTLEVQQYINDELVNSEQFVITDSTFVYKYLPPVGDSKLTFKATDKYGNTTTTDVSVTRVATDAASEEPEYQQTISRRQINDFVEMQKALADDDLEKVISESDVKKQQFSSLDEQIEYIKELARDNDIDEEKVDELALKVAMEDNILTQSAVDYLEQYAGGELKEILEDIDIYEQNLKTWDDLLEYIEKESEGRITAQDVNEFAESIFDNKALQDAVNGGELNQAAVIQLAKGSEGELREILENTDVEELGLKTWDDLLKHIEQQSEGRITADDVNAVASDILAKQALEDAYINNELSREAVDLLEKYATGELKDILGGIDVDALGLKTWDDLLKYIEEQSEGRITADEVNALAENILKRSALIDTLNSGILTQTTVDILEKYADDNIKEALKDVDIYEQNLKTWDDLVDYVEVATDGGVTAKEFNVYADSLIDNQALADAIENNEVTQGAVDQLERYADGELETVLKSLDTEAQNINTWNDLLNYIDTETKGRVSKESVNELADEIIGLQALRTAIDKNILSREAIDYLEKYADGEMKNILGNLDIEQANLKTWDDLLNYVETTSEGRVTAEDVNALAMRLLNGETVLDNAKTTGDISQNVVDILEKNATGKLKEVLEATDINQEGITTLDELKNLIISEADNEVTEKDIDNLVTRIIEKQALENAINDNVLTQEAVDILEHYAEGELKSILKNTDIESEDLNTWNDLIEYIEEQSDGRVSVDEVNKLAHNISENEPLMRALKYNEISQEAVDILAQHADGELKEILENVDVEALGFDTWNDLLKYVEEQSNGRITSKDINALAQDIVNKNELSNARSDNKITQDAIDLLERYATGELKDILHNIDIEKLKIDTWDDFLKYIEEASEGRINGEDVNALADDILNGKTAIADLRSKILAYSTNQAEKDLFLEAIDATDARDIIDNGEWLKAFYEEAKKLGATDEQIASMLSALTSEPGDDVKSYLENLINVSDPALANWLRSIDLDAENIKDIDDLIKYILANRAANGISEETLLDAFAKLISEKDLAPYTIEENTQQTDKSNGWWLLWILLLIVAAIITWYIYKKKRDNNKK